MPQSLHYAPRSTRIGERIMNSKITVTAAAAATIAAAVYLRYAVKPVAFAFRTGRALGLAERDQDVKVLIHAVADATRMLQDADLWHPAGKETQDVPLPS